MSRIVKVDVNNSETQMSVLEAAVSDLSINDVVEDHNPDLFVIVYAVDDTESFGKFIEVIIIKNPTIAIKIK